MDLQMAFLALSSGIYLGGVLWLWCGLRRRLPVLGMDCPRVSAIIAARDEEETLADCLEALAAQDYRGELEVVVVDDRSRDRTWTIIRDMSVGWTGLKGLKAEAELRYNCPKKSALAQGIEASTGTILLFTDADCRPPVDWVSSMVAHFSPGVDLVAGYARSAPIIGVLAKVLAVDNLGVGALGAGSFGMGSPLSCTGRNLGYRREVYDEVGGFEKIGHLIGGDDVYFMRLVGARGGSRMVFNREVVVLSNSERVGVWTAVQQKLRHSAKGGHYKGGGFHLAVGVYLFLFFLCWGLMQMLWDGVWDGWVLGIWALRWLVDLLLLGRMATSGEHRLLGYLPLVEVLYIPYVLIFPVLGYWGWFRWKS